MAFFQRHREQRRDEDGQGEDGGAAAMAVGYLLQEIIIQDRGDLVLKSSDPIDALMSSPSYFQIRDAGVTIPELVAALERQCGLAASDEAERRTGNFQVELYEQTYTFACEFDGPPERRQATIRLFRPPSCAC